MTLLPVDLDTTGALALFDRLPAARAEDILGRWTGAEVPTGHPMDGLLTASGWYGKQFDGPESVHPLLFTAPDGTVFPVDPRRVPLGLAGRVPVKAVGAGRRLLGVARPALRARGYGARLRNLEYRGVVGAAMIYDALPIIDVFRRMDGSTLFGAMDRRGMDRPYFFALHRV